MLCRERRSWTAKEDQLLRDAVEREDPENPNPSKWHAIAKHVPNRTNKDCRKRWFAKMASDVVKGGWSPDEDEKLVKGIERFGTRWSLVASMVQSRNSDQCAKRWTDTLNPAIDRTTWTAEADELLLQAVNEHGKVWTKIVKTYFPGRTGLSAKNRYNSITRFNSDHSRSSRPRRKTPDLLPYLSHRKSESVSSSSSSVSPSTPSIPIPDGPHSLFSSAIDSVPESYFFEHLAGWPQISSPSEASDEISSFYSSPDIFEMKDPSLLRESLLVPSPNMTSEQSFELTMNHALSAFPLDNHFIYSASPTPSDNSFPAGYLSQPQTTNEPAAFTTVPNQQFSTYSQFSGVYNDDGSSGHLKIFGTSQAEAHSGLPWGGHIFDTNQLRLNENDRTKASVNSYVF